MEHHISEVAVEAATEHFDLLLLTIMGTLVFSEVLIDLNTMSKDVNLA